MNCRTVTVILKVISPIYVTLPFMNPTEKKKNLFKWGPGEGATLKMEFNLDLEAGVRDNQEKKRGKLFRAERTRSMKPGPHI